MKSQASCISGTESLNAEMKSDFLLGIVCSNGMMPVQQVFPFPSVGFIFMMKSRSFFAFVYRVTRTQKKKKDFYND